MKIIYQFVQLEAPPLEYVPAGQVEQDVFPVLD
jgi:hypothetical protein